MVTLKKSLRKCYEKCQTQYHSMNRSYSFQQKEGISNVTWVNFDPDTPAICRRVSAVMDVCEILFNLRCKEKGKSICIYM